MAGEAWTEEPTVELRIARLRRDGDIVQVLQQAWRLRKEMGGWDFKTEWRDVPVVEEE